MLLKPIEKPAWIASWCGKGSWKKPLRFGVTFLVVIAFTVLLWSRFKPAETADETSTYVDPGIDDSTIIVDIQCPVNLDLLDRLGITRLSKYLRREVITVQSDEGLPLVQHLNAPLIDASYLDRADQELARQLQAECFNPLPITLYVPRLPEPVDASHIDFGVATTLERLNESIDVFSHWAGHTNTRIFVLLEPHERASELSAKADALGINLYITESDEEYQTRYFSLVGHLGENMRDETRWSCIIDDDTFFPSMRALVDALEQYDDSTPVYLGGLSESIQQIAIFGLMAYGGAGIFLSRPLIEQLMDPLVMEECQLIGLTGDRRLSYCIYQHTTTHLTVDHRLRQLDIMGDVSGFFEAARETPLSVHHWKSWFDVNMGKLSAVANVCGDSCLFRKWHFSDDWVLTNGFSVVQYSDSVDLDDPIMEYTWYGDHDADLESFLHALGPLRSKDWGKVSYDMKEAVVEDGKVVRQYYVRRDDDAGDEILELVWRAG